MSPGVVTKREFSGLRRTSIAGSSAPIGLIQKMLGGTP